MENTKDHFTVHIYGKPIPQPRTRTRSWWDPNFAFIPKNKMKAIRTQHYVDKKHDVMAWKHSIMAGFSLIHKIVLKKIDGPVKITMFFTMPRTKGHYGTGRNAGVVKASAAYHHIKKGDIDNLVKAVLDAMVDCAILKDDNIVCDLHATKRYGENPGVEIEVERIEDEI